MLAPGGEECSDEQTAFTSDPVAVCFTRAGSACAAELGCGYAALFSEAPVECPLNRDRPESGPVPCGLQVGIPCRPTDGVAGLRTALHGPAKEHEESEGAAQQADAADEAQGGTRTAR